MTLDRTYNDVPAIGRPAQTGQGTKVTTKDIRQSKAIGKGNEKMDQDITLLYLHSPYPTLET